MFYKPTSNIVKSAHVNAVEYEKMWQYLIQLHPEMWDIAFRNTVCVTYC